jgi:hypothetical protein
VTSRRWINTGNRAQAEHGRIRDFGSVPRKQDFPVCLLDLLGDLMLSQSGAFRCKV